MKDIKVLLLQGGLEVISEVEEKRSLSIASADDKGTITGYRLNKPFRILPVPLQIPKQTAQGVAIEIQITPQMVPLMAGAIQSYLELKPSDIIGEPMAPAKQFESAYVQRITGLQLA